MEKPTNTPEKSDKPDKTEQPATKDAIEKVKKDYSKVRTKTSSPMPQKGSVKKVKVKPSKPKISKTEVPVGVTESPKKVVEVKTKSTPGASRPMPLSKKNALVQEIHSPKSNDANPTTPENVNSVKPPPQKRQKLDLSGNQDSPCDPYCWACHKEGTTLDCQVCPRSFHVKCDNQGLNANEVVQDPKNWICKECRAVILAEDTDTRSPAMSILTIEQLCNLLKYALNRIKQQALKLLLDSQPDAFNKPVSVEDYPRYLDYVVHPVDLSLFEKNIKKKVYGSTEAFIADVKWLHHNSVVFNGSGHRLTTVAKGLVNTCKTEMREIETCPDCYLHAHTLNDSWFLEPCRKAHVLVWAKLKGFPYWPGKVLQVDNGNADVRFFGAHDRAWVPNHLCYMLSYEMPQPLKVKKKAAFDSSLEELDAHIQKLRAKLGGFDYAPPKTPLDPERLHLQPISKVSTGRRHSDADQNAFAKGRTVTIVTSSWMRRLQAEGFAKPKDKKELKKSPKKSKKQSQGAGSLAPPPASRMRGSDHKHATYERKDLSETKIKVENQNDGEKLETTKNPPPMGVFEISDSNSLDINQPLRLLSPSIVLSKVQMKPCENAAEKIKQSFLATCSSSSDVEMENEDDIPLRTIASNARKTPEKQAAEEEQASELSSADKIIESVASDVQKNPSQCEVSSTTTLTDGEKQIDLATLSAHQLTPKKTNSLFAQKLHETIQSCKAKLGIEGMDDEIAMPVTESDEEDEQSSPDKSDKGPNSEKGGSPKNNAKATSPKTALKKTATTDNESNQSNKSPTRNDFSNVSSDDGENLVIDEDTKDYDNDDASRATLPSGNETEILNNETITSKNVAKEKTSNPIQKKSFKRNSDGARISTETANTATKQTERSLRSPSPVDSQVYNGTNNPAESDPSNITNYAHKLIDFMQELCKDAGSPGNPQATIRSLELEIEKLRWRHQQELLEIKHNTDLILLEVRASLELDKRKCLAEIREKLELEKQRTIMELKLDMEKEKQVAVENTKKTQWCANCGKEAIFYCCWNTSYCDYNCQQAHWMSHMNLCTQNQPSTAAGGNFSQNTATNIPILTRQRMVGPQTSTPVLSGPIQLQYVTGNQCYQLVPTSTINVTPSSNNMNTNLNQMTKSYSNANIQQRPVTMTATRTANMSSTQKHFAP